MATSSDKASSDLPKIEADLASEVLERYEPSKEALALTTEGMSPARFLKELLAAELFADAISFLAYGLPRREALWWGLACVREITPEDPDPPIAAAIEAADAWVQEPGDELRRKAMLAAEAATYGTPAGCLALAVFFSEGSMAPADCPEVPVGEWFCARTVAAAIHLASLIGGPDQAQETASAFADSGLGAARNPAPWEGKE